MPEQAKGVKSEESPASEVAEQDVKEEGVEDASAQSSEQEETQPEPGQGQTIEQVDDRGVPWKQRALEYQRKVQELSESIPQMIDRKVAELSKPKQEEPKYTIAQLEQLAIERPEYRPWAEEQKEKIRMEQITRQFDEKIKATEAAKEAEFKKQKAYEYAVTNYPDMFVKDASGRPVAWNNEHPMTREVAAIMQDPRLTNDPDGLQIATDIAYGRYMRSQLPNMKKAQTKMKQVAKKLEAGTMVEGGGKSAQTGRDSFVDAKEKLAKSGSIRDAQAAVSEYFKKLGTIK